MNQNNPSATQELIAALIGVILVVLFNCLDWNVTAHAQDVDMAKISMIESSNEPLAFNNGHVGLCQISQGVVSSYNDDMNLVPSTPRYVTDYGTYLKFNLEDMYSERINLFIGKYYMNWKIPRYLKYYGIPDTVTSRIIAWNWGIGHLRHWFKNGSQWRKLPLETRNYIRKYFNAKNS